MVKEVIRALRSILSEQRRPLSDWVNVLPAAQGALNTSFRERYRRTPYCVMLGRAPRTASSTLVSAADGEWKIDVMNAEAVRNKVKNVVEEQVRFCKQVQGAVALSRTTKRKLAQGRAVLPKFAIGYFVVCSCS